MDIVQITALVSAIAILVGAINVFKGQIFKRQSDLEKMSERLYNLAQDQIDELEERIKDQERHSKEREERFTKFIEYQASIIHRFKNLFQAFSLQFEMLYREGKISEEEFNKLNYNIVEISRQLDAYTIDLNPNQPN